MSCCFLRRHRRGHHEHAPSSNQKPPTAVERAQQGVKTLEQGKAHFSYHRPNKDGTMRAYHHVVCPRMATRMLSNHERNDTLQFQKPDKGTILLAHALTNVSGETWERQRPLIQAALNRGNAPKLSRIRACRAAKTAAASMLEDVIQHSAALPSKEKVLDIRLFALKIAIAAMATAVVGDEDAKVNSSRVKRLEPKLRNCFQLNLLSTRSPQVDNSLMAVVQNIVDEIASLKEAARCLAGSLQKYETSHDEGKRLSRSEVICNCHSSLLAGTQTVATALVGAIAHMAEHHTNYDGMPDLMKKVTHEALRILPPVITLPRINPDFPIDISISESSSRMVLPKNSLVLIDTLVMAHYCEDDSDDEFFGNTCNTWKFCPEEPCMMGSPAPFGLGKRACPAGQLSVECIASALEQLVDCNLTWRFEKPNQDSVGPSGQEGWVGTAQYLPTVCYPRPITVIFSRKDAQVP